MSCVAEKNRSVKPGWKVWRFDQIATNVNDRIDNPSESGLEHYVGLEHLDPDSLKIKRWGSPDDVEATKLIFKKDDVIFGRRRAYQRKLGVAEFDGICSAHAMVLRAKPEVVLPEFLPFFIQSDTFMNRAIEISVGSLSPTINWKKLAVQEFALPPIEEQEPILRGLETVESTCLTLGAALTSAAAVRAAFIEDTLFQTWDEIRAKPLGNYLKELNYGLSSRSSYEGKGYPILRIPNVLRGKLDYTDLQRIELDAQGYERFALQAGDVLIVRTNGNPQYVGRSIVITCLNEKTVYASYLIRLRSDVDNLRPAFLAEYLNAPSTRQRLRGEVKSSAGNYNLNTVGIKRQPICVPDLATQDAMISTLTDMDAARTSLELRREAAIKVKKTMLARSLES
jgi:type I restriction enzyme S subunit